MLVLREGRRPLFMSCMGMFHCEGYGLQVVYSGIGNRN